MRCKPCMPLLASSFQRQLLCMLMGQGSAGRLLLPCIHCIACLGGRAGAVNMQPTAILPSQVLLLYIQNQRGLEAVCTLSGVVGPLDAPEGDLQDEDVYMSGTLSSPECGIVLGLNGTTTHVEEHYAKAINYTLMVTAVSFLQARHFLRPHEHASRRMQSSPSLASQTLNTVCVLPCTHTCAITHYQIALCMPSAMGAYSFKAYTFGAHAAVDVGRA